MGGGGWEVGGVVRHDVTANEDRITWCLLGYCKCAGCYFE